jgi:glyoxylase-like metal-dependent hydrolase (beta-lactamase superfamily II)
MNFKTLKTGFTNNYLIKGKDGYLLIDTGIGKDYNWFLNKIKSLDIDPMNINHILITHHHSDHTTFLNQLLKDTNAKLIIHKNEMDFLASGKNTLGKFKPSLFFKFVNSFIKPFFPSSFSPVEARVSDIILYGDDETTLKEIGIDGVILHTPGHTPGSLSVVLSDGKAFVGDCVMNLIISRPEPFVYDNLNDLYKSWTKLKKNDVRMVYPAHGKMLSIDKIKPRLVKEKESAN